MNLAVVLMEHVSQLASDNFVPLIDTAHQVNLVAILIKVLLANVLDLVLENLVNMITIAN